ncbi:glycosyltransferase family 8 protein [Myxosarcina sp. GI1]|uniref:glycosyltransferase family 8 protein n=1 Tax=Myxosarcina sp. GI1 TaxID=1541065 RepID=UPI000566BA7A|nr:glycosyltransferase family 8 protein [Myxosarcina sp. GI1]
MQTVVLVCAADNNYAIPLAATICSVLKNLEDSRKLELFIIDGGIEENNRIKITKSLSSSQAKLQWLKPLNNILDKIDNPKFYYSKAIYYRLFIPELLSPYKKAIYLDSDVIVNEDIGKLWNIDMENKSILAVRDLFPSPHLSSGFTKFLNQTDSKIEKTFNSGVLVMDLEKWRKDKVAVETMEYVSKWNLHTDQEGLNIVFRNKWKEIDPRWNRTSGIYEYNSWENSPFSKEEFNKLLNEPYIIHFTSAAKPWNSINSCLDRTLFYRYLDMSAWSGWRFTQWKRLIQKLKRVKIKYMSKLHK